MSMSRARFNSRAARALAILLAATMATPLRASPGEINTVPALAIGQASPAAPDIKAGDASVSTQTGGFRYTYPIAVPPGRLNMQPALQLAYSSQGPIYGGIAAGWSLDIPEIRRDIFPSILKQDYGHVFDPQRWRRQRFVSTLAGGRPLIEVDEPTSVPADALATYRAQNDETFDRYERLEDGRTWRVRSHTGVTHYFGEPSRAPFSSGFWAPLTRSVDAHGNTVEYIWSESSWSATNLQQIRYTSNPDASPALPAFAQVDLDWEASPVCTTSMVVGQSVDSRLGIARGVQRLEKITAIAHAPGDSSTVLHTRQITLGYDAAAADCAAKHGPINLLTSIQESAWGNDAPRADLPAVTFEYNRLARTFDESKVQPAVNGSNTLGFEQPEVGAQVGNLGSGTRRPGPSWPSVETMALDFDGDGLQDRLYVTTAGSECKLSWQKNLGRQSSTGNLVFAASNTPLTLPRLPWAGSGDSKSSDEWCSLSAQYTRYANRAPDGEECTQTSGSYLAYRWLDMTGDGLPDLVTGIHHDPQFFNPDFINTTYPVSGGWPACDATDDLRCSALDAGCVLDSVIDCSGTTTTCDFGDEVATCVDDAPRVACGALARTHNQILDGNCFFDCLDECFGCSTNVEQHEGCPDDQCFTICQDQCTRSDTFDPGFTPALDCDVKAEYQRCGGYPWMIYENTGGGLAVHPMIRYQPIPLESDNGDSSFGGGYMSGTNRAVQDIDGDGNLDAIIRGRALAGTGDNMEWWEVYPGDGHGGFETFTSPGGEGAYLWHVPPHAPIALGCASSPGVPCNALTINPGTQLTNVDVRGLSMLVDLTGDGAADLVWKAALDQFAAHRPMPPVWTSVDDLAPMVMYPNDGRRFLYSGPDTSPYGWPMSNPSSTYLSRSYFNSTSVLGQFPTAGTSTAKARLFDLDGDGRLDLLAAGWNSSSTPAAWGPMSLYINGGGSFLTSSALSSSEQSKLTPETKALPTYLAPPREYGWALTKDLIDLDGDGLLEAWTFNGEYATYYRDSDRQPLRLLKHIDNGRGGRTDITYGASTDTATVTQDAGQHRAMPAVIWVVSATTSSDQWDAGDDATTSYAYRYPVWNQDDDQRWGFRGFEEVTTTKPSGGKVVADYGYVPDWRGKATLARMYATEDAANPRTITEEVWTELPLFGGAISTFHPSIERSWTCATGQTEATCRAADAGRITKISTWANKGGQLWVMDEGETRDSATYDAGDRRSVDDYDLVSADSTYRLHHVAHSEKVSLDGIQVNDVLTNYQTYTYDPDTGDLSGQSQYFAADMVDHADTTFSYDTDGSGVKIHERRPRHQPSGPERTYAYDATKRFVVSEANELGQTMTTEFDPGTGAQLSSEGPNRVSCGGGCNNVQKTWTDVDGLGRPIGTYVNREVSGVSAWAKTKTSTTSYRDGTGVLHPGTVVERLIDYDANRWTREETQVDGRGRPTRITTRTGGPTPDAVTITDYDPSGNAVAVTRPDPSAAVGSTATVTTTYGYDSLGRAIWTRRPAAAGAASGLDVVYDGLTVRSADVTGARGGVAARKVIIHDHFGRMSEVREYTDVGSSYVTTSYQYGPRDAVSRIESPDGVITELTEDFAGRRTKIVRGGRTWDYDYDSNGNLLTVVSPAPSLALLGDYTISYVYDDIDRPTSRSVGGRDLSSADQGLLGVGMITFGYDDCLNGIGNLCTVTLPGGQLTTTYAYDAEGNRASESRHFNFGGITGTRAIATAYGPDRRVAERTFADNAVSSSAKTRARYAYDDRALPEAVAWVTARSLPSPDAPRTVASQTRNVAGQVMVRSANLSATPGTTGWRDLTSTWTYDELGHATSQVVADSTGAQYARQTLTYYGLDDPATLQHVPGSTTTAGFDFAYTYDARHQLTGVSEGAGKFTAGYGFTAGGKLHSANVSAAGQVGGTVINRNVTYAYGSSVDPEAVSALKPVGGGTDLRNYSYDTVGNLRERRNGAPTANPTDVFLYDGEDHLRRARKYSGTTVMGTEEYYYDHEGQRAAVVTRAAAGSVSGVRVFIGATEIELSGSGSMLKAYANLGLGTPVGRVVSPSGGWVAGSTAVLAANLELTYQGLSSNSILSLNPNGAIYAAFVYGPYGEVIQATGPGVSSTRVRFNGKFRDTLTTLHYYGARYYDDLSLSWTQADPKYRFTPDAAWGSPRRGNLYSFTGGNPLRYLDPDGKDVYFVIMTNNRQIDVDAARTRVFNIWSSLDYDPKEDLVYLLYVPDLGTIAAQVAIVVNNIPKQFGYTVEASVFGHSTGVDGPRGDKATSGPYGNGNQLTGAGWAAINFNWKPYGQSHAYFYGCRAFTWARDVFAKEQAGVGWAAGFEGWTYPSIRPNEHMWLERWAGTDQSVYMIGTSARNAFIRDNQQLAHYVFGADYSERMKAVRPDGRLGQVSYDEWSQPYIEENE